MFKKTQYTKLLMDHPFSTHTKLFRKTNISCPPWYAHIHTCASQGLGNVDFSENFAYVLNKWSPGPVTLFCDFIARI